MIDSKTVVSLHTAVANKISCIELRQSRTKPNGGFLPLLQTNRVKRDACSMKILYQNQANYSTNFPRNCELTSFACATTGSLSTARNTKFASQHDDAFMMSIDVKAGVRSFNI